MVLESLIMGAGGLGILWYTKDRTLEAWKDMLEYDIDWAVRTGVRGGVYKAFTGEKLELPKEEKFEHRLRSISHGCKVTGYSILTTAGLYGAAVGLPDLFVQGCDALVKYLY